MNSRIKGCLNAAMKLSESDTQRFVGLMEQYEKAGMDTDEAAQAAVSDLKAEIMEERKTFLAALKEKAGSLASRVKDYLTADMFGGAQAGLFDSTVNTAPKAEAKPALAQETKPMEKPASPAPKVEKPADAAKTEKQNGGITDFGEKIGGARKDVWKGFQDQLAAVPDKDIAVQPLSKSWPLPDYETLLKDGADAWAVGFARAARDEIPTKPKMAWKVSRWTEQVKLLRDMTAKVLRGEYSANQVKGLMEKSGSRGMQGVLGRIELYQAVGHKQSLEGLRLVNHAYSYIEGVKYNPPKSLWVVEKEPGATVLGNMPRTLAFDESKGAAIAKFKERMESMATPEQKAKAIEFGVFSKRAGNEFWIGKKIGANPVFLSEPFPTLKAAREYLANNHAEFVGKLARIKEIPSERRESNLPRVGVDLRNGIDVTPQFFADAFGFRGVEFGNWVEQDKRQANLNEAFDALMDMAGVLNIPPKAISLNGELGLAFGARGGGGKHSANAHYESDKVVINLTKTKGAGSLGHEWWHALDSYFSRARKQPLSMMTEAVDVSAASRGAVNYSPEGVRKEMVSAYGEVLRSIRESSVPSRSAKLDAKRSKEYWTTKPEMSARAFESYLIAKLQDNQASNDYLANVVDEEMWKASEALGVNLEGSFPYPLVSEMPAIRAAFDGFFGAIQSKETEKGVVLFSKANADFAREALVELLEEESFRYRKSTTPVLEFALQEADPEVQFLGDVAAIDEDKESGAQKKFMFKDAQGKEFYVYENGREIWADISRLEEGSRGAGIYAAIASYAHNDRKVFIEDPAGLSITAMRRRTEMMLSSALKYGTTRHIEPGKMQQKGNDKIGVKGLEWEYGNDEFNIQSLIERSYENTRFAIPDIDRFDFDFLSGRFVERDTGNPLSDRKIDDWSRRADSRSNAVGVATIKRGIVLGQLLRTTSSEEPGVLAGIFMGRAVPSASLAGIFYSILGRKTGNTSSSVKAEIDARLGQGAFARMSKVSIVETISSAPKWVQDKDSLGVAGAFHQTTRDIVLIADRIPIGQEVSVLFHEIGHGRLQQAVGREGVSRLRAGIEAWRNAPTGSNERVVFEAANRRAEQAAAENAAETSKTVKDLLNIEELAKKQGVSVLKFAQGADFSAEVVDTVKRWSDANLWDANIASLKKNLEPTRNEALYQEELLAYAIEEAESLGLMPDQKAKVGTVEKWLGMVKALFTAAMAKLFRGVTPDLTVQDLSALARGAAALEMKAVTEPRESVLTRMFSQTEVDQLALGDKPEVSRKQEQDLAASGSIESKFLTYDTQYKITDRVNDLFKKQGPFNSWWHKTVGTQYHKATLSPAFKKVYDLGQKFIADVSKYANDAANLAPTIIPRIEGFRDLKRGYLSKADSDVLAKATTEGTLMYRRDSDGDVVAMKEGEDVSSAGVVWSDAELKERYGMNAAQVALYREQRNAVNKSLDDLGRAEMLRMAGEDAKGLQERIMGMRDAGTAGDVLFRHLEKLSVGPARDRYTSIRNTAAAIKDYAERIEDMKEKGYSPLMRFGKYAVHVKSEKGDTLFFSLYESEADANKAARDLKVEFPSDLIEQGTLSENAHKLMAGINPDTLELFAQSIGAENGEVYQDFLRMTKSNRSALKRMIHRKGIDGYSVDAPRTLASFIMSNSRAISGALNMGDMAKAANEIDRNDGNTKDEAIALVNYLQNPTEEAQRIRGFMFTWYLGGSIASAMVNMTQPLTMTYPWLSQFVGAGKAGSMLASAMKDAAAKNLDDKDMAAALKQAEDRGIVSPQEIHQLQAQASQKHGTHMAIRKTMFLWGSLFGLAEQFNRRVTFIAAYRVAKQKGMADPYAFAEQAIAETQGTYNKGNRPDWARGAVGATIFCVDDKTEALTQNGWKGVDDIRPGDQIASFDMQSEKLLWKPVGSVFVKEYSGPMIHATSKTLDMFTTPDHRVVHYKRRRTAGESRGATHWSLEIAEAQDVGVGARWQIPTSAPFEHAPVGEPLSDEIIPVIGWLVTEGYILKQQKGKMHRGGQVYIGQNEGSNAELIRHDLAAAGLSWKETYWDYDGGNAKHVRFCLKKSETTKLRAMVPNKQLTPELLLRMSSSQIKVLVETMLKGDGSTNATGSRSLIQNQGKTLDTFCMALSMLGISWSIRNHGPSCKAVLLREPTKNTPGRYSIKKKEIVEFSGRVWCPIVPGTSTWVARRNGMPFITHNTFKQFSISYLEFLKRLPPKERALALAIVVIAAGVQGLPGSDDLDDVIDTLAQHMGYAWNSKEKKRQFLAEVFGRDAAEVVMRGFSAMPGVPLDVAGRLSVGNLIPGTGLLRKDKTDKSGEVFEVLGPAGGLVKGALDGNVLPVAFANAHKGYKMFNTGMYTDTKGRKVMDTDTIDALMKGIGFQPAEVARESREAGLAISRVTLAKTIEADIAGKWAEGRFEQNESKVKDAQDMLRDWNSKNPESRIRITPEQVNRRVKQMRMDRQDRLEKTAPRELRSGIREMLN